MTFLVLATFMLASCGAVKVKEPPAVEGAPSARGPFVGLELMTWTVSAPPRALARGPARGGLPVGPVLLEAAVAPYRSRPVPVAPQTLQTWALCGLDVVCVPIRELTSLRERLSLSGGVSSQKVLLSPRWVRAVIGPSSARTEVIELDSQLLRIDRGAIAMLVRSWAAPAAIEGTDAAPRAVARVQVVPQVVNDAFSRARETSLFAPSGIPTDEDKGLVLTRLTLEAVCDGEDALVIFPLAARQADVQPQSTPGPEQTDTLPKEAPDVPDRLLVPRGGMGPETPRAPLLGEALLTPMLASGRTEPRTILIIAPYPPAKYQLVAEHR